MNFVHGGFAFSNGLGGGGGGGGAAGVALRRTPITGIEVNPGTGDLVIATLPADPLNGELILLIHQSMNAIRGLNYNLQGAGNRQILWLGNGPAVLEAGETLVALWLEALP